MQTINNRFEIKGVTPPVFAFTGMPGGANARSRTPQRNIPVVNSAAILGNSKLTTFTISVQPFVASRLMDQVVPLTFEVISSDGTHTKLSDVPFEITLAKNGQITLNSESQDTAWRFKLGVKSGKNEITVGFTLDYSGLSIAEALEGAQFYEALVKGGHILISARNPVTGGYMPIVKGLVPAGAYKSNAHLVALLEHLKLIEVKTGVSFSFPGEPISVQQANDIAATAKLLKTGHATYQAEPWVSLTKIEEAKVILDSFKDDMHHPMAVHFSDQMSVVFGEHIPLGPVTLFCDRTYVTANDLEELRRQLESSDIEDMVSIRFTPFENCPVEARYLRWVSEDEAAELRQMPMYEERASSDNLMGRHQINMTHAVNLLEEWYDEDAEEQQKTWELLKTALDEDRLSDRKLFP